MVVLAIALPRVATADPVTLALFRTVSAGASVAVRGQDIDREDEQSNADVLRATAVASLEQNRALGIATTTSQLSGNSRHLSGHGGVNGAAQSGGSTFLRWAFQLDHPTLFDFTGTFTTTPSFRSPNETSFGGWSAAFHGPNGAGFSDGSETSSTIAEHGRLAAGLYDFELGTGGGTNIFNGSAAASVNFDFAFNLMPAGAATPEPGVIFLCGGGLLAAVSRLRKREKTNGVVRKKGFEPSPGFPD
jgi:hypothetical protein